MKKNQRFLALCLTALMLLAGVPALAADAVQPADLLFTGGVVYTVDAADTVAEALAVRDGRIVFVGTDEDAQAYAGDATEVIDLAGNMMLPGLIDSHLHSVMPSFFDLSLVGITTLDDTLTAIRDYVEAHPEKETFFIFGYMTNIFEGDEAELGPRKERLDEIISDRPLAVLAFDGHTVWVNSKFYEAHGITEETESPRGGIVVKDPETGALWGSLKDAAAALGGDKVYDDSILAEELPKFVQLLNSYGYTSIMTLPAFGTMPVPFDAYLALEEAGSLNIKVHGAISVMDFRHEEDLQTLVEAKEKYNGSALVKMNTAKFFMDGVVDTRTAFMLEPYEDVPDSYGMSGWDLEVLQEVYTKVNEAGIQIHTHAIGDAALRLSLDAMEYAREHAPEGDYRNAITHLQIVDEADIPRLGELGIVAVAQPYWHYKQEGYFNEVEKAAVGERAEREYPMKSFLDTGAVIASSSDYPVTTDPNPFQALQIGVTRNMPGNAVEVLEYGIAPITDMDDPTYLNQPEERLTIQEMIRSFTMGGAYLLFEENETGSLEVGKAADLVIIDQNLLTVDPLEIINTQVLQTYVDGRLVFERAD